MNAVHCPECGRLQGYRSLFSFAVQWVCYRCGHEWIE